MVSISQIREVIYEYLAKTVDLKSFNFEISKLAYDVHKSADVEAVKLCRSVDSMLANIHSGDLSEASFRDVLSTLVPANIVVVTSFAQAVNAGGASNAFVAAAASPLFVADAGKSPSWEYAS